MIMSKHRNKIKFYINKKQYLVTKTINLNDLLRYLVLKQYVFILEYNHIICDKKNWHKYKIKENDNIEIITIVGGG